MEASMAADKEVETEDEPRRDPINRGIPFLLEPDIVFWVRPCGVRVVREPLTHQYLCRILGATITQLQRLQAKAAVAVGGLGLRARAASDHGPAA